MRIVVAGGTGLIGERVVRLLQEQSHDVVVVSRSTGVDLETGKGLAEALVGAEVVVDVADTPDLEGQAPLRFFDRSSKNLAAAELHAGVQHHVGLSIVGVDRLESNYFWAKTAQEAIFRNASVHHTIVRSTQFFELVNRVLHATTGLDTVRLPPALVQPIASDDVAEALSQLAVLPALNATIELAGPEQIPLSELARLMLSAREDPRPVISDVSATFFGAELGYQSLVPGPGARIAQTTFADWLRQQIRAD
ncbi:MAG: SDR family oxidoreductase [Hyphomicrobiales bacterium]|nr:MAG: SDR family oxidoreductase [Hyphomicrobiales bacterium]